MNHRPTPLRAALDQLTLDFADAVLRAVRTAVLENLDLVAPSTAPAREQEQEQEPDAPRAPRTTAARTATPRRSTPATRTVDPIEAFPDDSVIVDPSLVLGFIDAHREAKRAPSEPRESSAEPIWEPKRETQATTSDDAPDSNGFDEAAESAPVSEAPPVYVPVTRATSPSLRSGEEVLRTATGGLVLRRRSKT